MGAKPTNGAGNQPIAEVHGKMVAMNEALVLGSVRQHELTALARSANAQLQKEITERKQVEAALRKSEKRYRTLFDLGPVAIYSLSLIHISS